MIYTFYSFKGGVGRSMALANVAQWLYEQELRVIMVDWDLEAPGLEGFFCDGDAVERVRSRLGLIDLLTLYKSEFPQFRADSHLQETSREAGTGRERRGIAQSAFRELLLDRLPPLTQYLFPLRASPSDRPNAPALWLMPAGWRSGERFKAYADTVQAFDWSGFYTSFAGQEFFEWLRDELERLADVILIDSRTGVTEMGGVCTRQLADVVVVFCAPNDQNLEGAQLMGTSFVREDLNHARGRDLNIVMVPTRVDTTETDAPNRFKRDFTTRLVSFTPAIFNTLKTDFWELLIPYVREYAYSEKLAIGDSNSNEFLVKSYKKLAAHLTMLAPGNSALRKRLAGEIKRVFGGLAPTVLVIRFGNGSAATANILRERLAQRNVPTWPDLPNTVTPGDAWREIAGLIDQSRFLVPVLDANSIRSDVVLRAWRYARERGVWVHPVVEEWQPLETDLKGLPGWIQRARFFHPEKDFDALSAQLELSTEAPRAPFMAPPLPPEYIERRQELAELRRSLVSAAQAGHPQSLVVIAGPGGSGKTVFAQALAHDREVNDIYEDGVLWVRLGADSDVAHELAKVCTALTGQRTGFRDQTEAVAFIRSQLSQRRCLMVLDDALSAKQLERFLEVGPHCTRLVTTRDPALGYGLTAAKVVSLGQLNDSDGSEILRACIGLPPSDTARLLPLARRLSNSALATSLAGALIRQRIAQGESVEHAVAWYQGELDRSGLAAVGSSLTTAVDRTLSQLSEDERQRYLEFAILAESGKADLGQAAGLWDVDGKEAEKFLLRLTELSLADFDLGTGVARIHTLLRSYVIDVARSRGQESALAEVLYSQLQPEGKAAVRHVFLHLVKTSTSGLGVPQTFPLEEFDSLHRMVAKRFVDKGVLKQEDRDTGPQLALANESLLTGWVRLANWVNEEQEFLLWLSQLRRDIAGWRLKQTTSQRPYMKRAAHWLKKNGDALTVDERRFAESMVARGPENLPAGEGDPAPVISIDYALAQPRRRSRAFLPLVLFGALSGAAAFLLF